MLRELKLVECDPSWGVSAAPISDADLFTWHCNVAGHPPGGGEPVVLHIELTFPQDYPSRPPKVEVLGSTVRHPNVFSTFICLDMLEGGEWAADEEKRRPYCGWSSAYSILAILRQLQTFFFEGDGTQWWDCALCTLRNPINKRRCDACDQARGKIIELTIDVAHRPGFRCRCGHEHNSSTTWPPFPDPINCDDAPTVVIPPDHPEDSCVICLGGFDDVSFTGPLRGSLGARPLAQLVDRAGQDVCSHWFHAPCAQQLRQKCCPVCRRSFHHHAVRTRDPSAPALTRSTSQGSQVEAPLCDEARDRMARLAEWPLALVIHLMSLLRRHERSMLGSAIPAWRDGVLAPVFWEAQELQCFHEKSGPNEDVIGIGLHAEGRGKLSKLTAHFDAVSLTAWRGGLRRAAWKEPMTHWLPLFINNGHSSSAFEVTQECLAMLAECAPTGTDSHLPSIVFDCLASAGAPPEAVNAVVVLPELMHQLLKQVTDGDRHASSKLLKGYFVLHRLFLHFCDQWPAIRTAADEAIKFFAESPEQRTKTSFPWMAYLLQLLTVSNVGWDYIRKEFVDEGLARDVQFVLAAFPNYRPLDPDVEKIDAKVPEHVVDPFAEWALFEHDHGTDIPGDGAAEHLRPGVWRGRPCGWACLTGSFRSRGRHAFSIRVRKLPKDGVIRIGWSEADIVTPFNGWFYLASGGCFGSGSWALPPNAKSKGMPTYGKCFKEGDLITACIDRGIATFRVNEVPMGHAFTCGVTGDGNLRPVVALKRGAEVELLETNADPSTFFATPEDLRNMAWEARLCRRGKKLVMFQVFFLSLVRPCGDGAPDWESLKQEYDRHLGFPSQRKSDALMEHFGLVHGSVALSGTQGWPLFFKMLGFGELSTLEIDRLLFKAYQRATLLNYKIPGRHDHA